MQKYYPVQLINNNTQKSSFFMERKPQFGNMAKEHHEPIIRGFLGETNNVSKYALGEFETLEAAEKVLWKSKIRWGNDEGKYMEKSPEKYIRKFEKWFRITKNGKKQLTNF
jgi:hypothetical protein